MRAILVIALMLVAGCAPTRPAPEPPRPAPEGELLELIEELRAVVERCNP